MDLGSNPVLESLRFGAWSLLLLLGCGSTEAPERARRVAVPQPRPSVITRPVDRSDAPTFAAARVYADGRLAGCRSLPDEEWVEAASLDPDQFFDLHVAAWGDAHQVFLQLGESGGGVEGESRLRLQRVRVPSCQEVDVRTRYRDGFYLVRVEVEPTSTPAQEVAEMLDCTLLDPTAPEQGGILLYAGMNQMENEAWLETVPRANGPRLGPPLFRPQPWFEGPPRAAPGTYDPVGAVQYFPLDPPARTRRAEGHELWASPLRGRNGGFVLAQYDVARNRHRWVFWSRHVLNATEASWGPSGHGLALAYGWSRHPIYTYEEGFFVLDLTRGTAHRLLLPSHRPRDFEREEMLSAARSPEEALAALDVQWTPEGLRYRDDGEQRELTLVALRQVLDRPAAP